MKMTKIAFWKRYLKYQPDDDKFCTSISCKNECPYYSNCEGLKMSKEIAEAYIKRHEQKTKKKDHILDTTKKVEEPKPIKTVGIDNSDVALTAQYEPVKINIWVQSLFDIDGLIHRGESVPASRETAKEYYFEHIDKWYAKDLFKPSEPTPLQIAKMIRDNGYSCIYKNFDDCRVCPFIKLGCGHSNPEHVESFNIRKKLIDDYISANEPVKDCPVNSEYPQPIKFEDEVPGYVYIVTNNAVLRREVVQFVHQRYKTQKPDMFILTVGGSTMSFEECYRTPEEALQVAKKLWNGEGK